MELITPELVEKLLTLPEDELAQMGHSELLQARKVAGRNNQAAQDKLSAAEHRAFAREYVSENPSAALPLAVMTPVYQLSKMMKFGNSRSNPSLDQAASGLTGIKEGLAKAIKGII